jgi:tetratricopeptide (TPR) repeat protein
MLILVESNKKTEYMSLPLPKHCIIQIIVTEREAAILMETFNRLHLVYCLSIHTLESATSERETSEAALARQDRFNVILAEHLKPHIKNLRLSDIFVKFTGKGFLLMTDMSDSVPALSCLGVILARTFNDEVAQTFGIAQKRLPALRISLFSGHDRRIEMPDGRREWVGDSIRKAAHLAMSPHTNKVLVDDSVRSLLQGGFKAERFDAALGTDADSGSEAAAPGWVLSQLDLDSIVGSGSSELYIYTLGVLGRMEDASYVAQAVATRLIGLTTGDAVPVEVSGQGPELNVAQGWSRLLSNLTDYPTANALFRKAKTSGAQPTADMYNTLVALAPDFDTAKALFMDMEREGIRPDSATYNALIANAPDLEAAAEQLASMREAGLVPSVHIYDAMIAKSDYAGAKALFMEMEREGIRPDIATFNLLIAKAPDYEAASYWLSILVEDGGLPSAQIYGALIAKAPDFETGKFWLETMERDGLQPNIAVFNKLIPKAPGDDIVCSLLDAVRAEGIRLNIITYNMLISKAIDFDTAKSWLEAMEKDSVSPNLDTYNRLLSKNISSQPAEDLLKWYLSQENNSEEPIQTAMATYRKYGRVDQALRLAVEYPHLPVAKRLIREIMDEVFAYLNVIREESVQPSVASYNAIIAKAPYFDAAKSWLDSMRRKGVQPDIITYNVLISKSAGFERARSLVEMMQADDVTPTVDTFNKLFEKDLSTVSADELILWYRAQESHSEEPIETAMVSFKRIGRVDQALRLALDYPRLAGAKKLIREYMVEVLSYLETIRHEGVKPNVVTYSSLISKAPYYDIAVAWLETMRAKDVKPNAVTYNTLIFKAPDFETAQALLGEMRSEAIEPNVITYSTLISKTEEYESAADLFAKMEQENVQPNTITYNALMLKSPDYEVACSWLEKMKKDDLKADVMTFNTLIYKAPDYETAEAKFREMGIEGIQPNIVTYNRLFSKDLSAKSAEEIIVWYLDQPYHPDEPLQAAISAYRKVGRVDHALRLTLDYPHLQVARKLMRDHADEAMAYFKEILDRDPDNANAAYALGLTLIESGNNREAEPHLIKAISCTQSAPRRKAIEALVGGMP